jgi:hypothetical protein
MESITLTATIREDRTLVLQLPADVPTGEVEIVIQRHTIHRLPSSAESVSNELTREEARRRLKAAGLLAEIEIPSDALELTELEEEILSLRAARYVSESERARLRHVMDGQKPISEAIIEDREDRV